MDCVKIGKLIAKLRKKKSYTEEYCGCVGHSK